MVATAGGDDAAVAAAWVDTMGAVWVRRDMRAGRSVRA